MKKTPILTIALAATLIGGLAGCTGSGDTTTAKTPKPTATSTEKLPKPLKPVVNKCVDGQATIVLTQSTRTVTLSDACDEVSVVGAGGTVTLAAVKHLVIEGDNNKVNTESLEKVDFGGSDNTITYTGAAPTVNTYKTTGNTVTAR